MGQGFDVCLGDPREARSMEECFESEFVRTLVVQAGLVMFGRKPAAVFGFTPRAWKGIDARAGHLLSARLFSLYAQKTAERGMRLAWLTSRGPGCMLLAWRPALVRNLLSSEENRAFLVEAGLPVDSDEALACAFVGRLRAYYAGRADFPHEVGLMLGYPVEDVRGFMADGGRGAKVVGCWRCYGDVLAARRRFEELGRAELACKRLYAEGVCVGELLRMGAA